MADISKITLPSGTTYDIKDAVARADIADLKTSVTGGMHYLGVTTTALTDGATTNPIKIDSANVTAVAGDIAVVAGSGTNGAADKEFVFNGTKWQEFGSTGSLKALAFKDNASVQYTPAGAVTQPTFTGTAGDISVSGTATASNIAVKTATSATPSGNAGYTPAGTVSQPTFTGSELTVTGDYTPAGSVSKPTFTGTKATLSATYTPAGSVSNVAMNTTTVNSITAVGTLPSWSATVTDETLSFSWGAGTLPTKGANTTVATTVKTQPSFTGTEATISTEYTPAGTVSQPTFTGTKATLSLKGTPAGTVSKPTFTGTKTYLYVPAYAGGTISSTGTFTPAGTVSKPTFSGTKATITVS